MSNQTSKYDLMMSELLEEFKAAGIDTSSISWDGASLTIEVLPKDQVEKAKYLAHQFFTRKGREEVLGYIRRGVP